MLYFLFCSFCFFFFKQKTAYEMRISDWSSDVCSSDLRHVVVAADCRHAGNKLAGGRRRALGDRRAALRTSLARAWPDDGAASVCGGAYGQSRLNVPQKSL